MENVIDCATLIYFIQRIPESAIKICDAIRKKLKYLSIKVYYIHTFLLDFACPKCPQGTLKLSFFFKFIYLFLYLLIESNILL